MRLSTPPIPIKGRILDLGYEESNTFRRVVARIKDLESNWAGLRIDDIEVRLGKIEGELDSIYGQGWRGRVNSL